VAMEKTTSLKPWLPKGAFFYVDARWR